MKNVILFFKELGQRFVKPTPYFFKILSWLGGIATTVTGIPKWLTDHNFVLPPELTALENKTVAIAGLVVTLVSLLTVKDATTISTDKTLPITNKIDVQQQ